MKYLQPPLGPERTGKTGGAASLLWLSSTYFLGRQFFSHVSCVF
jgi:hypothetical protein